MTLLMLGDSLIEWGDWKTLLPKYKIINRGIAGEEEAALSVRLNKEIRTADNPGHLLIMSGANNLLMDDLSFPSILQTMLPRLRQLCPQSIISVNAILPMNIAKPGPKVIKGINRQLRRVTESAGCSFLRVDNAFNRKCHPIAHPCFLNDGVHLSAFGYQIWAREINNHLQKLNENVGA